MARSVDREEGDTFEAYCDREFEAMAHSFPGATLQDVTDVAVPGKRSMTKQIMTADKGALVTIIEEPGYFVWFGVFISHADQLATAPALFRQSVQSYRSHAIEASNDSCR